MLRKSITYALIVSIVYIIVVGYLGFAVRDDFFVLTFPSWPFLINCFENCGYKMLIALCANGIILGLLTFAVISVALGTVMFTRKLDRSFVEGRRAEEAIIPIRTRKHPPKQKKRLSSLLVSMVVLFQGLLTIILLIAGLGFGFSVPEPMPPVLILAVLSGAALVGLIARQWWALVPASLLILGLGFAAFLLIGVGSPRLSDIEWYVLFLFGLFILVPIATIVLSIMATGAAKPHQPRRRIR